MKIVKVESGLTRLQEENEKVIELLIEKSQKEKIGNGLDSLIPPIQTEMKIYISGPITGIPGHKENFLAAESLLKDKYPFAEMLSPLKFCSDIPDGSEWEIYMARCIRVLLDATHIFMLDNWEESRGARIERTLALKQGSKEIKL